jgi:hypothetical protein
MWLVASSPLWLLLLYYGTKTLIHTGVDPHHDYANRLANAELSRGSFRSAELCRPCHRKIYDQWKESYLAKSWTSSITELALHRVTLTLQGMDADEVRFCLECHAPLSLTDPPDMFQEDPLSQEGVTCTVCHSTVVAHADVNPARLELDPLAGMGGPFDDASSPFHATVARELFTERDNELCGACHLSEWPRSGMPIDATWREWQEHGFGPDKENCVDCHMPLTEGRAAELPGVPIRQIREHTFLGGHDPETVRDAARLDVSAEYEADRTLVRARIENLTGHNLPTGNPPAPELRIMLSRASGDVMETRTYRFAYLQEDGMQTYDPTIAVEVGNDNTMLPYEVREEVFEVDPDDVDEGEELEVRVEFSYWRPYEPEMRLRSYTGTIYDHLTNRRVNLVTLVRTFSRAKTWATIFGAIGASKGEPIVIDRRTVPATE